MNNDTDNSPKAPYMPYTTFRNFLSSFKEGAVPSRIDKTLMPGFSGSMQSWTLSAMRFFDLIDANGIPTVMLTKLVGTSEADRQPLWKEVFEKAYASTVKDLDLQRATLGQLNERFSQDFSQETVKKCQSFFSAAAEDAGVVLSDHIKPRGRTQSRKPRRSRPNVPKTEPVTPESEQVPLSTVGRHTAATLLLDKEGARKVVLHAPPTVTTAELERIKSWMSFQLIVEDPK